MSFAIDNPHAYLVRHKWILLAFVAGAVNAASFLCFNKYVSHVTGTITSVGLSLGKLQGLEALELGMLLLSFFVGGLLSTLMQNLNPRSAYRREFGIIAVLLLATWIGNTQGIRPEQTSWLGLRPAFCSLLSLALACGFQNAVITLASRSTIRTTHLTGLMTDLSIDVGRLLGRQEPPERIALIWRMFGTRLALLVGFIAGATVTTVLHAEVGIACLLLPTVICLYLCADAVL